MKSRDFKTLYFNTLSSCFRTVRVPYPGNLLGQRFRLGKVRARGSHGNACYAQVNIQENSSYVVIIEAPYLLSSQPSALIINSVNSVLVIPRSSNKW